MDDRFAPIAVGKVLPPPTHIPAPCPATLESPLSLGSYEGMDDMGDYAVTKAEASPLLLSTSALLAEVPALAMRIAHSRTHARDVLLVRQLAARLKTASLAPPTNREPLIGALWIDVAEAA